MAFASLPSGLYAITDPQLTQRMGVVQAVTAAIRGGARWIQYRNKQASPELCLREAQDLALLCGSHAVPLIINDNAHLACEVDAAGVHIGVDDTSYATARNQVGERRLVGVSCYASLQRAIEAQDAGADYVAFGSIFPSSTKPIAKPASLQLLTEARLRLHVPILR